MGGSGGGVEVGGGPRASDAGLVAALAAVWDSIAELGDGISGSEWDRPTECPGWTVKDNLAHVIGIESVLLGRPAPADDLPADAGHVRNDLGRVNEIWVAARRSRTGREVLAEFRAVTEARLDALRRPDHDFDAEAWTPVGPGTVRDLLGFRIFDSWAHEQDMRRALGRPGGFDEASAAARASVDRVAGAMPWAVGRNVRPSDGTTVVFDVSGPLGRRLALRMVDGRARAEAPAPEDPDVTLAMSTGTFVRLGLGRVDAGAVIASGDLVIRGDRDLGERIAGAMSFVP